jgi:hypothetical protein
MNQRVFVRVEDSVAYRNACSFRSSDDGVFCDDQSVKVDDLRAAAARVKDFRIVQLRVIALLCAGIAAMGDVEGLSAAQLRMWLLERVCWQRSLPWQAAARIVLYLCVSADGLPLPILIDVALLDYAIDVQARNVSINPTFVSLYRAAVPSFIHSCARLRIASPSQRFGPCDGVLWKVVSPNELLPLLEAAGDLKVDQARTRLMEYFEGGMKRLMTRLNHAFHDQTPAHLRTASLATESEPNVCNDVAALSAVDSAQSANNGLPSPPPLFNLRRMSEGAQLALALGALAPMITHACVLLPYSLVMSCLGVHW